LKRRRRLGRRHDRHASQPDTAEGNLHPGPRDQPVRADGRALGVAGRGRPSTRRRRRVHTRAQRADRRTDRRRAARATDHTTRTDQHPVRAGLQSHATMERLTDRLARRWVPVTPVEARHLLEVYQQLPDRTAAARLAFTAPTHPERRTTSASAQLRLPCNPAMSLTAGASPTSATFEAIPGPGYTLAGRRWQRTCEALDPRLLADPHWPVPSIEWHSQASTSPRH